ncbi:MAG: hypothetical protein QOG87_3585 [Actinomycetota bacterium]
MRMDERIDSVRDLSSITSPQTVAARLAWLRIVVGLTLTLAPRSVLRMQSADDPSGPFVLMTRTVGIRDFVVGVGSAAAVRSNNRDDVRRWLRVGLLSDVLDIAAAASSARSIGKRSALVAALIPLPVVAADIGALRLLDS